MTSKQTKKLASKKKTSVENTFRQRQLWRRGAALVVIAAITFFGVHFFVASKAYNATPGDVYFDYPANVISHPVGETFPMNLYAYPPPSPTNASTVHANIDFSIMNQIQFVGVTCSAPCKNNYAGLPSTSPWQDAFAKCFEFGGSSIGQSQQSVAVIKLKQLLGGSQSNAYNYGMSVNWVDGPCPATGDDYFGPSYSSHSVGAVGGHCGSDGLHCGGGGNGDGGGSGASLGGEGLGGAGGGGVGETGDGATGTPTAGGAGGNIQNDSPGGGTTQSSNEGAGGVVASSAPAPSPQTAPTTSAGGTATKQSEDPAPTPSTASQGSAPEQAKAEPTPFFDGKLFAIGSDNDEHAFSSLLTSYNKKLAIGWYVVVMILILIVGSFVFSYSRQKRR